MLATLYIMKSQWHMQQIHYYHCSGGSILITFWWMAPVLREGMPKPSTCCRRWRRTWGIWSGRKSGQSRLICFSLVFIHFFLFPKGIHPGKKATVVTYFIYRLVLPVVVFCNGPFPFSFSLFSLFQQLTCFADDWFRTAFLRYQKLLFCQLSHNNCRTH